MTKDWEAWLDQQQRSLSKIEGGAEAMAFFGGVPTFHDAEIVRLDLRRRGSSALTVAWWKTDPYVDPCVVTIKIGSIMDLELSGFSIQNVVYEMGFVYGAAARGERVNSYFASGRMEEEVEIALSESYGIRGFIRCLDVAISVQNGTKGDAAPLTQGSRRRLFPL